MNFSERITRRDLLKAVLTAGIAAGVPTLSGCDAPQTQTPSPVFDPARPVPAPRAIDKTEANWHSLPALERIKQLESGIHPVSPDYKELTNAVAGFFAQETGCRLTKEEMAQSVHLTDSETFAKEYEKRYGEISDPNKKNILKRRPEFTTKTKEVFINTNSLEKGVKATEKDPRVPKGTNIGVVIVKNLLLHSFAHLNATDEIYVLKFPYRFSREGTNATITHIDNLDLIGVDEEKEQPITLFGTNEAFTQYVADGLAKKTGRFGWNSYEQGVFLTDAINVKKNISYSKFRDYYLRKIPSIEGLLQVWGTPAKNQIEAEHNALKYMTEIAVLSESELTPIN